MLGGPLVAEAGQGPDSGRRGVENRDLVFFYGFPEPVWLGISRDAFKHNFSGTGRQRSVDDITMPGDPADVGRAPEDIVVMAIKDILKGEVGVNCITAGGMEHAF